MFTTFENRATIQTSTFAVTSPLGCLKRQFWIWHYWPPPSTFTSTYLEDEFHVSVGLLGQGPEGELGHWGEISDRVAGVFCDDVTEEARKVEEWGGEGQGQTLGHEAPCKGVEESGSQGETCLHVQVPWFLVHISKASIPSFCSFLYFLSSESSFIWMMPIFC